MLPLPILNVRLRACSEDWQQMTPTKQGHFCGSCQRTVLDFTQAAQSDLEAAFRASPDGRLCGRFRAEQLASEQPAPLPRRVALRPKLRRFLVALLLVCGLGLSAREAVGQVRKSTETRFIQRKPTIHSAKPKQPAHSLTTYYEADTPIDIDPVKVPGGISPNRLNSTVPNSTLGYVEQMSVPLFKGGEKALMKFIAANFHWPDNAPLTISGRVFVKFQITEAGAVRDVRVVKGLQPILDAEAVRVVKLLNGKFTPGMQNNKPVAVLYTIPITLEGDQNAKKSSADHKRK